MVYTSRPYRLALAFHCQMRGERTATHPRAEMTSSTFFYVHTSLIIGFFEIIQTNNKERYFFLFSFFGRILLCCFLNGFVGYKVSIFPYAVCVRVPSRRKNESPLTFFFRRTRQTSATLIWPSPLFKASPASSEECGKYKKIRVRVRVRTVNILSFFRQLSTVRVRIRQIYGKLDCL